MVKVLENRVVDLDLLPGKQGEDVKKSVDGATYVALIFLSASALDTLSFTRLS